MVKSLEEYALEDRQEDVLNIEMNFVRQTARRASR
jgi:hypothetical protein